MKTGHTEFIGLLILGVEEFGALFLRIDKLIDSRDGDDERRKVQTVPDHSVCRAPTIRISIIKLGITIRYYAPV